jgi:hypothetical protein
MYDMSFDSVLDRFEAKVSRPPNKIHRLYIASHCSIYTYVPTFLRFELYRVRWLASESEPACSVHERIDCSIKAAFFIRAYMMLYSILNSIMKNLLKE